jgi:lincosamide and streptogramin A transport system ATP-binding/permease protein
LVIFIEGDFMASIIINSLTYYYTSPYDTIFENLSLNLSTDWKLGLIGRNGKGKTTLLQLIHKSLEPVKGEVHTGVTTFYFPYIPANNTKFTLDVIRDNIAPFKQWEREMVNLLNKGDGESLIKYSFIFEQYQLLDGYKIDALIEKEIQEIGMGMDILTRKFNTLSEGEQTRALLLSLFLKKNAFMLIDEPTDHLDLKGRMMLGEYLHNKKGYIIISHDRYFLDLCIDHVLSINKFDVRLNKGNYSQWKCNLELQENYEKRKKENLNREVKSLEIAAKKRRRWSNLKEKEKQGAYDKGFVGHKSAKLMKRALTIENRITQKIEEKKSLLKNFEKKRMLKLGTNSCSGELIAYLESVSLNYQQKDILKNISLYLREGNRIAVTGCNGTGKTTLLKVLTGELQPSEGIAFIKSGIRTCYVRQNPIWQTGYLKDLLYNHKIDETKFRNILATLWSSGEIFERPLETFSKGEIKKVELCKSFLQPYDLLIWDEPLNYLDIASREQIEVVLLENNPNMIFVEHDIAFIEKVATEIFSLDKP